MTWSVEDYGLTVKELEAKHGAEHPLYPRADLGSYGDYWEWVKTSLHYEEYCFGEAHATGEQDAAD